MSHWYPHTIGTKDGKDQEWYWIVHPDLPGTFTRGESSEEDADWSKVAWWGGPYPSHEKAERAMSDDQGNPGSYMGPSSDPAQNRLPDVLQAQMTRATQARW